MDVSRKFNTIICRTKMFFFFHDTCILLYEQVKFATFSFYVAT